MHGINKRHVISAVLIALTAILIQQVFVGKDDSLQVIEDAATDSSNVEASESQFTAAGASERIQLKQENQNVSSTMIPLAALTWAADRGYHSSGEIGQITKRPFEYYDESTLQKMADDGDGLAQLILAERLSFSDPKKADALYIEAAINGKTAGLTSAAGDRLLIVPGQKGYGFPVTDAGGNVSDEYLEVLRFYAAAEYLGDFIGTELLASHLETADFGRSPDSVRRICSSGEELANAIVSERNRRWGSADNSAVPIDWAETPDPICQQP